jgi:hypothetical protein
MASSRAACSLVNFTGFLGLALYLTVVPPRFAGIGFPYRDDAATIAAPSKRQHKNPTIDHAEGGEPFFTIVSAPVLKDKTGRIIENPPSQAEGHAMLSLIRIRLRAIPFKLHTNYP